MKQLAIVVLLTGVVFSGAVYADSGTKSARAQVQSLMDRMNRAANAHDADRFMAAYLHKPTLVFVINGTVIHGWDALHKQQLEWWHHGKSDAVYTQNAPAEFERIGSELVVTTRAFDSRRTGADGKINTGRFAVTEIWRKLPQGWRIVYSHESWAR